MESDILDSLNDLGYPEELLKDEEFKKMLHGTSFNITFTQVVSWLSNELQESANLEEHINAVSNSEENDSFLMEVSAFLRELACPYKTLISGSIEERLNTSENRILLLEFLTTELSSARIICVNKPTPFIIGQETKKDDESEVAFFLKQAVTVLGLANNIMVDVTAESLFSDLEKEICSFIGKYPDKIGKAALSHSLSDGQWLKIQQINEDLCKEYEIRREMLLKRIDVTVQSFMWSKAHTNDILKVYTRNRSCLKTKSNVTIASLLASRNDLLCLQKTSSGRDREVTKCDINKILIGNVPDRGGRAWEYEIPREMPQFQKRVAGGGSGHRGGGRGGGGHRGGFHKSGHNRHQRK